MATRPTIVLDIRASNATWDATAPVPLQGLNNKTPVPIAAKIANGWNGDEKPGAQEWNFYDNRNDQWVFWVTEGSALALLAPHIKESDASGNTAFASIVAGGTPLSVESISVTPNFGSNETGLFCQNGVNKPGAIFQTNTNADSAALLRWVGTSPAEGDVGVLRVESLSGGPTAIVVKSDSISHAIEVFNTQPVGSCVAAFAGPGDDGAVLDGGPAFFGNVGTPDTTQVGGLAARFRNQQSSGDTVLIENTNAGANGDCLVITGENRAICVKANQLGGKRPAARFEAVLNGGDGSAPLQLVPQAHDISGEAVGTGEGSIWVQEGTFASDTQHMPRFLSGSSGQKPKWFGWTNGPMCAINKFQFAVVSGAQDDLFFDIFPTLTLNFNVGSIPIETGTVIIRVSGNVNRTQNTAGIDALAGAAFQIFDLTADPGKASPIQTQGIDLMPVNSGMDEHLLEVHWEVGFEYVLPAAGQRVFVVEMARGAGSTSGSITVDNAKFELRPLP